HDALGLLKVFNAGADAEPLVDARHDADVLGGVIHDLAVDRPVAAEVVSLRRDAEALAERVLVEGGDGHARAARRTDGADRDVEGALLPTDEPVDAVGLGVVAAVLV